jgi:hypothetical protein
LTNKFKLDPNFVKTVDEKYGPFDWRLPEAHAVYWGAKGLEQAELHPAKVKPDDLIQLRRIIYQSTYQAFKHGRIVYNPFTQSYTLGPNMELAGRVNEVYEEMARDDEKNRDHIERAQRNALRDTIYFLYSNNRMSEAQKWFKYLGEKFPDKPIVENDPTSLPKTLTLDEYAVAVVQIDIGETSQERVTQAVQGLVTRAYLALVTDDDARYENLMNLALRVHTKYMKDTAGSRGDVRIPLPPMDEMKKTIVTDLLKPENGLPAEARAILRTKLGLPPESSAPAATNSVPAAATSPATTNAPAAK